MKPVRRYRVYKPNKETGIEKTVRQWLNLNRIPYLSQVHVWHFYIDFVVDNHIFVEVNGDYWHNLPERKRRDARLEAYCKNRSIPLIFIWEHEIKALDFTKLEPLYAYKLALAV